MTIIGKITKLITPSNSKLLNGDAHKKVISDFRRAYPRKSHEEIFELYKVIVIADMQRRGELSKELYASHLNGLRMSGKISRYHFKKLLVE